MAADRGAARPSLASREEADRFLAAFTDTLDEFARVLGDETRHLSAGRVREALSRGERKSALASAYLRALEYAKANAVALARFAPDRVAALRKVHDLFRAAVEHNQAVLATVKAVSEGLVRGVADEVSRQARPAGYGAPPPRAAPPPLVFSARL